MKIITVKALTTLLLKHGYEQFLRDLIDALTRDFGRWEQFTQMPRPAMHVPGGVLELMPICDNEEYYTFKYVNCHPGNTKIGLQTVIATGQLVEIKTGYPLLFTEMTILTALRTAAMAALVTDFLSRQDSHVLAIIGTGAQSEFQVEATCLVRDITEVRFFDIDEKAMDKFGTNLKGRSFNLVRCSSSEEAVRGSDIITVCTAAKARVEVLKNDWIKNGMHINALGGDTVGKTELAEEILARSKIFVEYLEQAKGEGEIQYLEYPESQVFAEINELIKKRKAGRESENEITLFDSVGIALEDYSVLRLAYELADKYYIGEDEMIIPLLADPKNLISAIQ